MIFSLKMVSDKTLDYFSQWRQNPILLGYYDFMKQSYNKGLSPQTSIFEEFSEFQAEFLAPLIGQEHLSVWVNTFAQGSFIKDNLAYLWDRIRTFKPKKSNPGIMVEVFHALWPVIHFKERSMDLALVYLNELETYAQDKTEQGIIWSFRYEVARYFKDEKSSYLFLEKFFEETEHHQVSLDIEMMQVDYFLTTIKHKGNLEKAQEKINFIDFNPDEGFMFCNLFIKFFKLEYAMQVGDLASALELNDFLHQSYENLVENHKELVGAQEKEKKKFQQMMQRKLFGPHDIAYFALSSQYFQDFFNNLDWKKLRLTIETTNHRAHVELLRAEFTKFFKKIASGPMHSTSIKVMVDELSVDEDFFYDFQLLIAFEVKLIRQKIYIDTLRNYLNLKEFLLAPAREIVLPMKEIKEVLTQKIFPNQSAKDFSYIYFQTVKYLIAIEALPSAIDLTRSADASVQKNIIQFADNTLDINNSLFLFLYYYHSDLKKSVDYADQLMKLVPEWKSYLLFLKYLKNVDLTILEMADISEWLMIDPVPMQYFVIWLLDNKNHDEMSDFLVFHRQIIQKQLEVKVVEMKLSQANPHKQVTEIDVLQQMLLDKPILQQALPNLEESSREEQIFQTLTKPKLEDTELVWDLKKLPIDHPLCQLVDQVTAKVKKENGQTDIHFVYYCGGKKINACLDVYDQFIVEQNGHSHYEIYEALKSLSHTLCNLNYVSELKTASPELQKTIKQKIFQEMVYPSVMKQKLFQEYQHLKKTPFEIAHPPDQNPFDADFFVKELSGSQNYYRPVYAGDSLLTSKTQTLYQIRWVGPHFRAVTNGEIKAKQLELYVQYQIREMLRKNHPLFVSGKIADKDDYLLYLLDKKIDDPNLKINDLNQDFEFPLKSINQKIGEQEIELIRRPTTHVSGYFKVYPVTE